MSSLEEILKYSSDLSVLRRILFAAVHLPPEMPKYWEAIAQFSKKVGASQVKTLVENIRFLNEATFATDKELLSELYACKTADSGPFGLILVSPKKMCGECGAQLLLRADRPSTLAVYTDSMGTVPATHYRKICSKFRSGCKFVQHYGFHCKGMCMLYCK